LHNLIRALWVNISVRYRTTVYQAAVQKIGHALGFGASSDPNSIMFAALGTSNPTLDDTGMARLALYIRAHRIRAVGAADGVVSVGSPRRPQRRDRPREREPS
jgi:hypothetical protein